jgi:hypothetical protein
VIADAMPKMYPAQMGLQIEGKEDAPRARRGMKQGSAG